MEWRVISPSTADQVPLSLSSCTVCAKLISQFLSLSVHSLFSDILISIASIVTSCSTLYFLNSFFLSLFFLLLMSFVGVVLRGAIVRATEATQSSQAPPNRQQKCPQGANSNMSVELSFSRRLPVSALMFSFDGSPCCIMGGGGGGEVLRGSV